MQLAYASANELISLQEFNTSATLVLLTITVHILALGIVPLLITPFGERFGRRPMTIVSLLVFVGANFGLIFVQNLAGFMVLRALQAAGAVLPAILG
jgi:MFS family permease